MEIKMEIKIDNIVPDGVVVEMKGLVFDTNEDALDFVKQVSNLQEEYHEKNKKDMTAIELDDFERNEDDSSDDFENHELDDKSKGKCKDESFFDVILNYVNKYADPKAKEEITDLLGFDKVYTNISEIDTNVINDGIVYDVNFNDTDHEHSFTFKIAE